MFYSRLVDGGGYFNPVDIVIFYRVYLASADRGLSSPSGGK